MQKHGIVKLSVGKFKTSSSSNSYERKESLGKY